MKKRSKRLLSMAIAGAMSCSMITGWANTMTVTKVEVLNDNDSVAATYSYVPATGETEGYWEDENGNIGISLTAAQRMQVTLALATDPVTDEDGTVTTPSVATDGEATFLSYIQGTASADLSDTTIQYVDQSTVVTVDTDESTTNDGTAVITFRPRTTLGIDTFVAQAGGTSVANADSFVYNVVAEKLDMSVALDNTGTIKVGDTVTFTVSATTLPTAVTITGITGATYDSTTGKITWTAVEGSHSVAVTADGYKDATAVSVTVVAASYEEVTDTNAAQDVVNNLEITTAPTVGETGTATVTLPATKVEDQAVRYTVTGGSDAVAFDAATGVITYTKPATGGKFAERVKVVAQVGSETQGIEKVSYIYFVPGDIAFGNVTAVVAADGVSDAFATAAGVAAVSETDKLAARADALKIVLGKAGTDSIADASQTLDWNHNDTIALSEYNIMRHMLKGTAGYTPEELATKRPEKTN